VSAVERAVEGAAREARRAAQKIVSGTSEQEKLWRDGFVRGAGWRAERMPGGGHVIAKPVALHLARAALAAAAPTVERVEALCRLLMDEGHMTAEGQRQVVALWGGGER